jgi:hypothetical protein
MAANDILALAKRGEPKVIAALLNHSLKPKGIAARVTRQDYLLHVLLESERPLNQQSMMALIAKGLQNLNVETIDAVKVYARQIGQKSVAWVQQIQLGLEHGSEHSVAVQHHFSEQPPQSNQKSNQKSNQTIASPDTSLMNDLTPDISIHSVSSAEQPVQDIAELPIQPAETSDAIMASPNTMAEQVIPRENHGMPEPMMMAEREIVTDSSEAIATPEIMSADEAITTAEAFLAPEKAQSEDLSSIVVGNRTIDFDEDEDTNIADILQRPEAVILLILISVLFFWDLYLDLVEDANTDAPRSGRELARRLGVNSSTISRRKDREGFSEWTKSLDPEGIAWTYRDGIFIPQDHKE